MKHGHLQRGLALLLLVLIFADLVFPQLCCEELKCPSSANTSVADASTERHAISITPCSEPEQHQESPAVEKGCFCCCAHILRSDALANVPAVKGQQTIPIISSLPLSPPEETFHPPRLA